MPKSHKIGILRSRIDFLAILKADIQDHGVTEIISSEAFVFQHLLPMYYLVLSLFCIWNVFYDKVISLLDGSNSGGGFWLIFSEISVHHGEVWWSSCWPEWMAMAPYMAPEGGSAGRRKCLGTGLEADIGPWFQSAFSVLLF